MTVLANPSRVPACPRIRLHLRRVLGSLALCGGLAVTLSTAAPYAVRTDVPVMPGSEGAILRIRDVSVVLPPPCTSVHSYDGKKWSLPWDGAPVLTLLNEGSDPVVYRTARASVVLHGSTYSDPDPGDHSIAPGECRSVSLTLRRTAERRPEWDPTGEADSMSTFCFGELVFPDGTVSPIEGELRGLVWQSPTQAIQPAR